MLGSVEPCLALTVRGCRDRRGSNPWSNNANASTFTLLRTPGIGPLSRPLANLVSLQRERLPQRLALAGSPNGLFPGRNLTLRLWRAHWIPKLPIMVVAWRVDGFRRYLVFYRELPDRIQVWRVLHGARDLHQSLTD